MLDECVTFISQFEGFSATPYQHAGDVPTIGFGSTRYEDNTKVTLEDPAISQDRGLEILSHFIQEAIDLVNELVTVPTTDNQLIALTSFEYNTGALNHSTLLAKLNGTDYDGAAREFSKWVHCAGVVLPGLVTRRNAEMRLFTS